MSVLSSTDRAPLIVFLLALGLATPFALSTQNHEFVFYVAVLVLLAVFVGYVHARVGLHPLSLWALTAWALAHLAGGLLLVSDEVGVLYNWWIVPGRLKYDQLVHAFGFGTSTWVAWQGLRHGLADPRPTLGGVFLAACVGMGLGACNEVVEFFATLWVPETNVGGYVNTGWDLVANAVGCALAGALIWRFGRRAAV